LAAVNRAEGQGPGEQTTIRRNRSH
jgi:hypothetical protein